MDEWMIRILEVGRRETGSTQQKQETKFAYIPCEHTAMSLKSQC